MIEYVSAPREYEDLISTEQNGIATATANGSHSPGRQSGRALLTAEPYTMQSHRHCTPAVSCQESLIQSSLGACSRFGELLEAISLNPTLVSGFSSAGFVSSSEPAELHDGDTPGLGSMTELGGAGLGATPQRNSDWDTPGLGTTTGLGATPGAADTPLVGGLGFVSSSQAAPKVLHS